MEQPQLRSPVRLLVTATAAAAAVVALLLLLRLGPGTGGWTAFVVFAPFVLLGQVLGVSSARGYTVALTSTGYVALALLTPPELAMLAAPTALAHARLLRLPARHAVFNVSAQALSVAAASAAAHAVGAGMDDPGRFAVAGLAAALVYAVVGDALVAAVVGLEGTLDLRAAKRAAAEALVPEAALTALGVVCAWLWLTNPGLLPFALAGAALVFRAIHVPQLEEQARRDPKTGLANVRAFNEALKEELARARRFGRPLAVVLADLDYLREINNAHGHLAGDAVIEGIAAVLQAELRKVDTAARFGGEEFAILLPETVADHAVEVAERIRRAVEGLRFDGDATGVRATISLGVAAFPDDGVGAETLLRRADEALYAAKEHGRNGVRRALPKRASVL